MTKAQSKIFLSQITIIKKQTPYLRKIPRLGGVFSLLYENKKTQTRNNLFKSVSSLDTMRLMALKTDFV